MVGMRVGWVRLACLALLVVLAAGQDETVELEEVPISRPGQTLIPRALTVCNTTQSVVVAGSTRYPGGEDIFVLKFKPETFETDWFWTDGAPGEKDQVNSVVCEADDSVVLAGWTDGTFSNASIDSAIGESRHSLVVRLLNDGSVWTIVQETNSLEGGDHEMASVAITPQGNLIFAGSAQVPVHNLGTGHGSFVISASPQLGQLPWSFSVGGTEQETAVYATSDGRYIDLVGIDRKQGRTISRLTRCIDGGIQLAEPVEEIEWATDIESEDHDVTAIGMAKDGNGFPLVVANYRTQSGDTSVRVIKFDSTGKVLRISLVRGFESTTVIASGLALPGDGQLYVHAQVIRPNSFEEYIMNGTSTLLTEDWESTSVRQRVGEFETRRTLKGFSYAFFGNETYFFGQSSRLESNEQNNQFSLFRNRYVGYRGDIVREQAVTLTLDVRIAKANSEEVTDEPERLREIIASDTPMSIRLIENVSTESLEPYLTGAVYNMTVRCSAYANVKESVAGIVSSEATSLRLSADVTTTSFTDDFASGICDEPLEDEEGAGEEESGGNSLTVPIVAGCIGGLVVLLTAILLFFLVYRPGRTSVYDLYGDSDEEAADPDGPMAPEPILTAEEAKEIDATKDIEAGKGIVIEEPLPPHDGRLEMRSASFGGHNDII